MALSVTNHFVKVPAALLKEIGGRWLSGEDLARLITTCRFMRDTFSSGVHRFPIAVYNGLGIGRHINSEFITTRAFQAKIMEMRDRLAPHVVTIVGRECHRLLRVALSSEKMTTRLRRNAVVRAASRGQLFALNMLLESGEISNVDRGFALYRVAEEGHLSSLQPLLASGPISEEDRGLALSLVARRGDLSSLLALLASGPILDKDRGLALIEAARNGHLSSLQALLASGPISDRDRGSAICNAARNGHFSSIEALLASGPISDSQRCNALFGAIWHLDSIKVLLSGLKTRPSWLNNIINKARDRGKEDIIAYLEGWKPEEEKSSA